MGCLPMGLDYLSYVATWLYSDAAVEFFISVCDLMFLLVQFAGFAFRTKVIPGEHTRGWVHCMLQGGVCLMLMMRAPAPCLPGAGSHRQ